MGRNHTVKQLSKILSEWRRIPGSPTVIPAYAGIKNWIACFRRNDVISVTQSDKLLAISIKPTVGGCLEGKCSQPRQRLLRFSLSPALNTSQSLQSSLAQGIN
jgi:hypothetical protein